MKKITFLLLTVFYSLVGYSQEYSWDFEGLPFPNGLPTDWNRYDNGVGTSQSWRLINIPPPYVYDTQAMYLNVETMAEPGTMIDYLITSPIEVPANGQLRFFAHQNEGGNQGSIFEVRYLVKDPGSNNQGNLSAYQLLEDWTEPEMNQVASVFEEKVVNLTPAVTAGTTIYIAFVRKVTQEVALVQKGDRWIIDNVKVVEKCLNPFDLEVKDIAASSVKLAWKYPAGDTPLDFQYQILEAATPTPDIFSPISTISNTLEEPVQDLLPDTDYKYFLRAECALGIYSEWVGPFYFSTIPYGVICTDPIQITDLPFETDANTGSFGNSIAGPQGAGCGATPTSTNFLSGNDVIYRLVAPLDGKISITLTPNGTRSSVFVYADCPSIPGPCLAGVANTNGNPRIITNFEVDPGEDYYIVISSNETTQTVPYNLIIQYENCLKPTTLGFSAPTLTGGNFTWTEVETATSWQIAVQNAGDPIPSGNGTYISDSDGVAGGYQDVPSEFQGVAAEYWVRSLCPTPGVFSAWAGPFPFNTLICETADQCLHTFRMTDSANNGWNGARMQIRQNGIVLPNSTGETTIGGNYSSGAGPIDVTVSLCPGIPFEIVWVTPGTQPQQCILTVLNSFGQTIYTKPAGTGIPGEVLYLSDPVNCIAPLCDIAPINVTISAITTVGATINWTAPGTENMAYNIYLVPAGDPAPSNGQDDPSQDLFTYTGTNGNTPPFFHTITNGLIADQAYDVYVRVLCTPFHSDWSAAGTFTTLPTCPKPTNPLVPANLITQTGATLTWTNGSVGDDKWEILLVPGTSMTAPTGTPPLNPGAGDGLLYVVNGPLTPTSHTVNNLTAATIYYYYIRTVCPGDDKSTWAGPIVFNTVTCDEAAKCEYKFYPTNTAGNSWNNGRMQVRQNGIIVATIGGSLINNANPVIVKLCPNVPFDLFWNIEGTAPANIGITVQNPFLDVIYTKAPGTGTVGTVLFSGVTNCTDSPCAKPTDITVSNVGPTSAQITWTDNSLTPSQSFDLYVVETGGAAPTNTPATTPTHTGVQSGYVLSTFNGSPLVPSTSYTFYVRAVCSGTETSTWTIITPVTFITTPLNNLCDSATPVTINSGQVCVEANTVKGNTYGATFSTINTATPITGTGCNPTNQDVWYSFVATSTSHTIMISNVVPTPSNANITLNHSVFSGTCGNMELVYCSATLISGAPSLVIGNTYYVRVYKSTNVEIQSATFDLCIVSPPANDECTNAITVTPNSGQNCNAENVVSSGTFASSATPIALDPLSGPLTPANLCGPTNDDVWFTFVPTSTNHTIIVSNVVSTPSTANVKLNYALFSGTCGNLNLIFCSNTNTTPTSGLVIGQPYYIRVYKATTNATQSATFDLCIISPPVNDECTNAIPVPVNPEQFCLDPNMISGNTIGSTASNPISTPPLAGSGCGATNRDIWYSFVATATSNMISFTNVVVTPSTATTVKLNHSVFSGTCDGLNRLYCSTDEVSMATGLTPGNTYYVRVYTSTNNNDHSLTFDLCITSPPANDECPNSIAVTPNSGQVCAPANMAHGSTLGASASLPILTPPLTGAGCLPNNNDIWYHFVATSTSHAINLYNINTIPANSTARLNYGVFSGTCDNLTKLYCSTTNYSNATGLTPGETYYIRIYSTVTSVQQSISFDLCITSPPVNDDCINALDVPVNADFSCTERVFGSTVGATISNPTITGTVCAGTNDDVWYKFIAGPGGMHFINVNSLGGNSIDVDLSHAVYSGTCEGLTTLYCSTNSSSTAMNLTPGQEYYIRVYTAGTAVGDYVNFNLCVKTPPPPAVNEDCATAMPIVANAGGTCVTFASGNIIEAGASGVPNTCLGNADDDVWFTFTALTNQHFINIFNVEGTSTNLNHAVYSGPCTNLSLLYCSAANSLASTNTGFVVGDTYYVRIWSNGGTPQITAFDICIKGTSTCETAEPFCVSETTPMIFPNSTQVPNAGHVACLFQTPNPTYYYLQVQSSGNLVFNIRQSTDPNNFPTTGAPGLDVDFVAWGPFDSPESCDEIVLGPCGPVPCPNNTADPDFYFDDLDNSNVVDCSYDGAVTENFYINNAVAGQYYLLLLTNFSQQPGYIKLSQANYNQPGAGESTNLCCAVNLGPDIVTCQPSVILDAVENEANAPGSYIWYFNNAIIENATASTYEATQTGVYKVVGTCGLNSASDEIFVEFLPAIVSTQPDDYLVCDDATNDGEATFNLQTITTASVGVDGLFYTISIHETEEDALAPASPIDVTVPYVSETKTIFIRIQSNSILDCYTVQPLNLVVNVLESSEFEYENSEYCSAGVNPLPLFLNGGIAGNFTATPGGLSINPQTGEINLEASSAGVYTIVNALDSNGACNPNPTSFTLTIVAQDSAEFTYDSTEYCNSGTATPIFANNGVAGSFSVDPSTGLSINASTGVINLANSDFGTYIVTNTIAATGGCEEDVHEFTITVSEAIIASISYGDPFCLSSTEIQNVTITGNTTGSFTATPTGLSLNATTGAINPSLSTPGTYTVNYFIPAQGSCDELNAPATVTILDGPAYEFIHGCDGGAYKLSVLPVNGSFDPLTATFTWSGGTQVTNEPNSIIVKTRGDYSVTITTPEGCATVTDLITLNSIGCDIQRGISPNNDGDNDSFDLSAYNVKELNIFNRYGTEVYSYSNYVNQWFGQSNSGDELPDGTYFYVIHTQEGENKTGWIYINR